MIRYSLSLFILMLFIGSASALNIYEQANDQAKVVFELRPGDQLIPIIQQDQWLKVANPKDGSIGWAKIADLQGQLPQKNGISYQQRILSTPEDGHLPKVYRVVEYSGPNKMTQEQMDEMIKQMHQRQEQMQHYMQAMMQNMFNSIQLMQQFDPFYGEHEATKVSSLTVPKQPIEQNPPVEEDKSKEANKEKSGLIAKVKQALTTKSSHEQVKN